MRHVVLYHADCVDGFAAAWAASRKFEILNERAEYHAMNYGDPLPSGVDWKDAGVEVLDFSISPRDVDTLYDRGIMRLVILDHHVTAVDMLRECASIAHRRGGGYVKYDHTQSGAQLAWNYFHERTPAPRLIDYVGDHDLWLHDLPYSREMSAYIASHEYTFDAYMRMSNVIHVDWSTAVTEGKAIVRMQRVAVQRAVDDMRSVITVNDRMVPFVNVPRSMMNDAADYLLQDAAVPFAVLYQDYPTYRKLSFRSRNGYDVSAIARLYGGGGHAGAAGARVPHQWRGETPQEMQAWSVPEQQPVAVDTEKMALDLDSLGVVMNAAQEEVQRLTFELETTPGSPFLRGAHQAMSWLLHPKQSARPSDCGDMF